MSGGRPLAWIVLTALGSWAEAGELRASHDPRPCILAGQFARIEARVEPASDAVRARVLFRMDGESAFYEVPMRREGERFVGVLPSSAPGTTRIAYFVAAERDGARARAPRSSVFLADVVTTACAEGAFPVSSSGPDEVGVPSGAPQTPPGFERRGIGAFVAVEDGAAAAAVAGASGAAALGVLPIAVGTRVRVTTSPGEQQQDGRLTSLDGGALVVQTDGKPVRIPRERVSRVEVHEPGSSGMRVLGGLVGGVAGLAATLLVCASADVCESVAVAWAGFGLGAAAGAAVTGRGSWRPVTLASAGPVALDLRPRPAGASAELRLGF